MAGVVKAQHRSMVICMDGTGNAPKAEGNTNVLRVYGMLDLSDPDRQIAFYTPGVGTRGDPAALSAPSRAATKMRGLVTGYGMRRDIADAYTFAIDNYRQGDRIFIFGFSRGAFAALALASIFRVYGRLRPTARNMVGQIVTNTSKPTRKKKTALSPLKFRQRFSIHRADGVDRDTEGWALPVHFIGLWDIVKALKYFRYWTALRESALLENRYFRSWPYAKKPELVTTIRHAVSIDDTRFPFDVYKITPHEDVDFEEVWFAGAHSDVGGSFDSDGENDLGRISLKWMVEAGIACGLVIEPKDYRNKCTRPVPGAKRGTREAFSATGPIHRNSVFWLPLVPRRRVKRRRNRRRLSRPEVRVHQSVFDRRGYKQTRTVLGMPLWKKLFGRRSYNLPGNIEAVAVDPAWKQPRPQGSLTNAVPPTPQRDVADPSDTQPDDTEPSGDH